MEGNKNNRPLSPRGKDSPPVLYLLPKSVILTRQTIPSFADVQEELIGFSSWNSVPKFSYISHNWFSESDPDNNSEIKVKLLTRALKTMRRLQYIWIDYACLDTVHTDFPQCLCETIKIIEIATRVLVLPLKIDQSEASYDMTTFASQAWCVFQACFFLKRPSKIRIIRCTSSAQQEFAPSLITLPSKSKDDQVDVLLESQSVAEQIVSEDDYHAFTIAFQPTSCFPLSAIWEALKNQSEAAFGSRRDPTDFFSGNLLAAGDDAPEESVSQLLSLAEVAENQTSRTGSSSPGRISRTPTRASRSRQEKHREDFSSSAEFNEYLIAKMNQYNAHDEQLHRASSRLKSREDNSEQLSTGSMPVQAQRVPSPIPGKGRDSQKAEELPAGILSAADIESNPDSRYTSPAPTKKSTLKGVTFAKEEVPVAPDSLAAKQEALRSRRKLLNTPSNRSSGNLQPWIPAEMSPRKKQLPLYKREGFKSTPKATWLPAAAKAALVVLLTVYTASLFADLPSHRNYPANKHQGSGPLKKGDSLQAGEYIATDTCEAWADCLCSTPAHYFFLDYDGQLTMREGYRPPVGKTLWQSDSSSYPAKSTSYQALVDKKGNLLIKKDKKVVKKFLKGSIPQELQGWPLAN